MTNATRQRAAALLDVLHYREADDRTADHCRRARRFRAVPTGMPALNWQWAWADNLAPAPVEGECALSVVRRWWPAAASRPKRSTLVLAGRTGVGKGVAVAWLLAHNDAIGAVNYWRAPDLGELGLGGPIEFEQAKSAEVLVLEELGREGAIGPTLERVQELLNIRHERRAITLITTNLLLKQVRDSPGFEERYGEHITDRLRGDGAFVVIDHASLRKPERKPVLERIEHSCRIADLVAAVDSATSGGTRGEAAIEELRLAFEVPEAAIEAAIVRRMQWQIGGAAS